MSKRSKVADLAQFDAAHYLDNESSIAAYLTDILEANDAALLAAALGDLARARGMTETAKAAGITREALYKALRPDSAPRFDTVSLRGSRSASGSTTDRSNPKGIPNLIANCNGYVPPVTGLSAGQPAKE